MLHNIEKKYYTFDYGSVTHIFLIKLLIYHSITNLNSIYSKIKYFYNINYKSIILYTVCSKNLKNGRLSF